MKKYFDTIIRLIYSAIILILLCYVWREQTMAFITIIAVVVALFKDKLHAFYLPPKLRILISDSLPHFHEVEAIDRNTKVKEKQAWLGVIIENIGIGSAKNVEVYFNGRKSDSIKDFGIYRSIPLIGSWVKNTLISSIPPGIEIRFDLCFVSERNPQRINFFLKWIPNALSGITCSQDKSSFFKFEIVALAENTCPIKREVKMEYKGIYKNGLKIR